MCGDFCTLKHQEEQCSLKQKYPSVEWASSVGEEFTDGKNRLKPQWGVEQISLSVPGAGCLQNSLQRSNMCQVMNNFFLCWVLPVLTPEEITAFTRPGCVYVLEKKCHLFFILEIFKIFM